ncbi:TMEM165/GDT1 family protein [Streptomyces albulus]|nr:TMEM165/GDT1 family protein [Streptomyces noursei]
MGATYGLVVAVFLASVVEAVEALTIVMAMGMTRGWRSAWAGTAAAAVALAAFTAAAGYALATWLPKTALQLTVGALLLVFGLQWLRKAVLRGAGLKPRHDEEAAFAEQTAAARGAGPATRLGLDWFAFTVSLKGVFLEGVEIVFIVITFGTSAHDVPVAAGTAAAAAVCVAVAGSSPTARSPGCRRTPSSTASGCCWRASAPTGRWRGSASSRPTGRASRGSAGTGRSPC